MPSKDDEDKVKDARRDGVTSPGSTSGRRKKKVLVKKKKNPEKKRPKTEPVEPAPKTKTRTVVEHPGGGEYYVEESDDEPRAGPVPGPSTSTRGESEPYYTGEEGGIYTEGAGYGEGVEITSIADDESVYTEATEDFESEDTMADKSKWKGKNLSYMTPQMMHALKMSQTQSQNKYKKAYNEEMKGKGKSGVETVESQRVKKLTAEQSLINYHRDFEDSKSKGYTAVTETPELNRIRGQAAVKDVVYKKEFMEQKGHNIPVAETPDSIRVKNQQKFLSDVKYQEDRNKLRGKATQVTDDPQTRRAKQAAKIASDVEYKRSKEKAEEMERRRQELVADQQKSKAYKHVAAPGSVLDYDPVQRMEQMSMQDKSRAEPAPTHAASPPQSPKQVPEDPTPPKSPEPEPESPQQEQQEPVAAEEFVRKSDGHIYRAMYDYTAQDDDEVTFMDGDTIINAQRIDDGWMFGTVERTGQTGMLPSNYVNVVQ